MIYTVLVVVQVVVAITMIGLILVQHGKGADAGAAFGSGASGTVFGAQGSANFLSRSTAALAAVFFAVSLTLAYLVGGSAPQAPASVTEQLQVPGSELLDKDKKQPGSQPVPASDKDTEKPNTPTAPDRVPE